MRVATGKDGLSTTLSNGLRRALWAAILWDEGYEALSSILLKNSTKLLSRRSIISAEHRDNVSLTRFMSGDERKLLWNELGGGTLS